MEVAVPAAWRSKLLILAAIAALAALLPAADIARTSAANTHAAVRAYQQQHAGEPIPVIVQAVTGADPEALVTSAGGEVAAPLAIINAVAADITAGTLDALSADARVKWISLDGPVASADSGRDRLDGTDEGDDDDAKTSDPASVYTDEIDADEAWENGILGQGIAVAVVDTGIANSGDFGSPRRVVATVSKNRSRRDGYGHGSHVAGIIAGDGSNSGGAYTGVAPGANLVNVKIGDDTGAATLSDVINGLQFVFENNDKYNIRVVNLSLRSDVPQSYTTDPLDAAVELLTFRGILVVASAGNIGTAGDAVSYAPANDPFVLTVGAVDDRGTADYGDDTITSWSSRGTTQDGYAKPELYAPGRRIVSVLSPGSVLAREIPEGLVGEHYFQLSGTSMSAAVVSGAAALVIQEHPDWTPGQVKAALMEGADALPTDSSAAFVQVDGALDVSSPADATADLRPNELLLEAAGITDPDAIRWGAIRWGAIRWGAIRWGAIRWGAIRWGAVRWGYVSE